MTASPQLGFLESTGSDHRMERVTDYVHIDGTPPNPPTTMTTTHAEEAVYVRVASESAADHMPAFVLEALGDALMAFNRDGMTFSSYDVRDLAEKADAVKRWLSPQESSLKKLRQNCMGGWFQSRVELHELVRVGSTPSRRPERRGAWIALWRFPTR